MKRIFGGMIATILILAPQLAKAKDFCVDIGFPTGLVFKNFSVPAKGTCKLITEINPGFPGLVASGSACTTTDGKTLLFNLTDGFFDGIETIQGAITLATSSGMTSGCMAPDANANFCDFFTSTVQACPNKPQPIAASSDFKTSRRSQFGH